MEGAVAALLEQAQAAAAHGDWGSARAAFETALAEAPSCADALFGLADALWWLGETRGAARAWEQAFVAYRVAGDHEPACFAGINLYFTYRACLGNLAAARGWLARCASVAEEHGLEGIASWVLLMRADDTSDPAAAERWASHARTLARAAGDRDLELCATSTLGAALVEQGRLEEGMALLDEALAGALAGEGERLDTVVYASCVMITACAEVAEAERVVQWVKASDGFCARYGAPHLFTLCRAYYGGVLLSVGRWAEAEQELLGALRIGHEAEPALRGEALARLAELRLAQGRREEAQQLLKGLDNVVAVTATAARLELEGGRAAVAAEAVRRRLREWDCVAAAVVGLRQGASGACEAARLLDVLVAAELAQGHVPEALEAVRRLAEIAVGSGLLAVRAMAERAWGAALVEAGEPEQALPHLDAALALYRRCDHPLEVGRCELLLARLPGREREVAVADARAALATFEALGAAGEADRAAAVLRDLGERVGPTGPRSADLLSVREHEVLQLVALGLTNKQIGERLFISPRTVEQHVRSTLTKLGLANRAEAAAYLARQPAAE